MILEDVSIVDLKTFPQNLVRVYFLELNKGLKFLAGANRTFLTCRSDRVFYIFIVNPISAQKRNSTINEKIEQLSKASCPRALGRKHVLMPTR